MKTNAAKIQELIGLAMKVQETTEYCVFISFSGHVDSIEIKITPSKNDYLTNLVESEFYTSPSKHRSQEYFDEKYQRVKSFLVDILKKGKIDYEHDSVWKEERVEYDYKF